MTLEYPKAGLPTKAKNHEEKQITFFSFGLFFFLLLFLYFDRTRKHVPLCIKLLEAVSIKPRNERIRAEKKKTRSVRRKSSQKKSSHMSAAETIMQIS